MFTLLIFCLAVSVSISHAEAVEGDTTSAESMDDYSKLLQQLNDLLLSMYKLISTKTLDDVIRNDTETYVSEMLVPLKNELVSLEANFTSFNTSQNQLRADIRDNLSSIVSLASKKWDAITNSQARLESTVLANIRESNANNQAMFASFESKMSKWHMDTKLEMSDLNSNVNLKLGQMESSITKLNSDTNFKLSGMDSRLTAIDTKMAHMKEDAATMKEDLSHVKEDMSHVKEDVTHLNENVANILAILNRTHWNPTTAEPNLKNNNIRM